MNGNRCLNCMDELPAGTGVCPRCGYDNSVTRTQGDELPPEQELAEGAYLVGIVIGRTDTEITYVGFKRETQERVQIRELFPSALSSRLPGFTSVMWQTSEEDWEKRRKSFVYENGGENVIEAFFQNNTAYIITPLSDVPQPQKAPSAAGVSNKKPDAKGKSVSKKAKIGILAGACAAVAAAIILIVTLTGKKPATGWSYSVEGDHVELTGTELDADELEIPSILENRPVTVIADEAFRDNTALVSVTIPDSVTTIQDGAFSGCVNLGSISIPDSVTSIGKSAFQNCESLEAIAIPSDVTEIAKATFSGCGLLESVNIPAGVTSIGEAAFENCASLRDVVLPESVTTIGDRAFANCVNLTVDIAPVTVTFLSATAFEGCALPEDSLKHTILSTSERGVLTYTVAIEPQYEEVKNFSNHLAAAKKDGKWGYINEENEVIIPFEYEYACTFNEGYAVVATDRQNSDSGWGYELAFIDVDNNLTQFTLFNGSSAWILDEDFNPDFMVFHNGLILFTPAVRTNRFNHFFDLYGKEVDLGHTPDGENYWYPLAPLNEGLAPVASYYIDSHYFGWVDDEGTIVYSQETESEFAYPTPFNQGLATVVFRSYDDEWNLIDEYQLFYDRSFRPAFPERFDIWGFVRDYTIYQRFGDTGLAMMSKDGKFGAIYKNGKTAIAFTFDELTPESEGMSEFQENGLHGYIDTDSMKKVIPAQFEMTTPFNGGFAAVYDGEKAFLINRKGERIPGTDSLDYSSYFVLDDDGNIIAIYAPGEYVVIEEDGKYGFGHLEYYPDLPENGELSEDLYTRAASAIAEELVPVALQNLYQYDITRKDMCALIAKSLEKISGMKIEAFVEEQTSTPLSYYIQTNTFQDTYTTPVVACEALNIIMGESAKVFNAYGRVTRQEAAAFLQRTAALLGVRHSTSEQSSISDSADVSDYFADSVQFVVDMDIMDCDENGAFMPLDNFTREEAFAAVYRLLRVVVERS